MNKTIRLSELREDLDAAFDRVCDNHEPLLVERKEGEPVVLVSARDYASLEETAYLLRSPANAKRLLEATRTPREDMKTFAGLDELKDEIGL